MAGIVGLCMHPLIFTASAQPSACLDDCARYGLGISGFQRNYSAVPSGGVWLDTDGNAIQAQGGGFLQVGSTFYWVGQDDTPSIAGLPHPEAKINLYSSTDLMNWRKVGAVISVHTQDEAGNTPLTYCNIERPKLMYNSRTQKYVIWAHWEMSKSYVASHVVTATAKDIAGPYTITSEGHRRPGSGRQAANAMGDRIGSLIIDYNTAAKDAADESHPLKPVSSAGYPPASLQYAPPNPNNPSQLSYVGADDYGTAQAGNPWTYELSDVHFGLILKAVAVQMTAYDASAYERYKKRYDVSAADYIVRYPTAKRSQVVAVNFSFGVPGTSRTQLVSPVISPGLDESSSASAVLMNEGDAAFITIATDGAVVYFTTDGTDPRTSTSATRYIVGTRIVLTQARAEGQLHVRAVASLDGKNSSVTEQLYKLATDPTTVPTFRPVINFPPGVYNASSTAFGWKALRIYCPSNGTECYYTMDGLDPDPPVLGTNIGYGSRDMTVWQDPQSETAYLVSAQDNVFGRLWQLNDAWTDVVPELEYDVWTSISREAPVLVRNGGKSGKFVYLLTSTQSGYFPNQGQYMRSDSIASGFTLPRDKITGYRDGGALWSRLQPFGDASTFYSQPTYVLDIGKEGDPVYIYVGDRYNTLDGSRSNSVWMPLTIDDDGTSEAGKRGSGSLQVRFQPLLQIDVFKNVLVQPSWQLLSLNKPVQATPSVPLSTAQQEAGTANYSAEAANDGRNYDTDVYNLNQSHFYNPVSVPYYWRVDLEAAFELAWIGLSFRSIGGSDAVNRYTVVGSVDGTRWIELVDNTRNSQPGFQNHDVTGIWRYIQVNVVSVWDVDHHKEADWETGVYQISIYGVSAS